MIQEYLKGGCTVACRTVHPLYFVFTIVVSVESCLEAAREKRRSECASFSHAAGSWELSDPVQH